MEHKTKVHSNINIGKSRLTRAEKYDGSIKLFKCSFCPKCFTKDNILFHHLQKAHNHTRAIPCEKCGETFNFRHQLRIHCKDFHPDEFINCKRCAHCYLKQEDLDKHIEEDHADDIPCEICGQTFVNRQGYLDHQKKVHADVLSEMEATKAEQSCEFQCEHCGKGYALQKSYISHLRQVHNINHTKTSTRITKEEKESGTIKMYCCSFCDKKYTKDNLLIKHEKAEHNHTRSYPCEKCDETFSYRKDHRQHIYDKHGKFTK